MQKGRIPRFRRKSVVQKGRTPRAATRPKKKTEGRVRMMINIMANKEKPPWRAGRKMVVNVIKHPTKENMGDTRGPGQAAPRARPLQWHGECKEGFGEARLEDVQRGHREAVSS